MRTKIKWLALLTVFCLVSAVLASIITAIFLKRGLFGYQVLLRQPGGEIPAESSSTSTLEPTAAPEPSVTPQPTVSPRPTVIAATPTPEPAVTPTPKTDPETDPVPTETEANIPLWQTPDWLTTMYEQIAPSVVGIRVEVDETSYSVRRTNEGSGIIMNEDGIIVTSSDILSIALDNNGRLLAHANVEILVYGLRRTLTAELVGRDPMTGISVLKVNAGFSDLVPALIAEEPEVKVGQVVFAIGYPDILSASGSLTSGIISALDRPVVLEDGLTLQMIRTDARLSQSCSGGPLVNLSGEVIAVTSCDPRRSNYDTQNQAIPAAAAKLIVDDLTSQGYVGGRTWLGVTVLVEETFIELQNLYRFPDGLYINSVVDGSPAYLADIRRGDIITSINGEPIDTSMEISDFIHSQPVGTMVEIIVYRRAEEQYFECIVYLQEYKN